MFKCLVFKSYCSISFKFTPLVTNSHRCVHINFQNNWLTLEAAQGIFRYHSCASVYIDNINIAAKYQKLDSVVQGSMLFIPYL